MAKPQQMPAGKVRAVLREERALELRTRGHTYAEIGLAMGVSKKRAWTLVERALVKHGKACDEMADQIRAVEMLRLDRMQLALDGDDSPRAVEAKLKIMERRARYKGLDAPTQQEVFGKDGVPLVAPVINLGFEHGGPGDAVRLPEPGSEPAGAAPPEGA